jgi:uncharacterized protein (UPF0332 family)
MENLYLCNPCSLVVLTIGRESLDKTSLLLRLEHYIHASSLHYFASSYSVRALAQAVSRRHPTAAARIRA